MASEEEISKLISDYGDRFKVIRDQGDYQLMIRMFLLDNLYLHICIPRDVDASTVPDIFIRGRHDEATVKEPLQQLLRTKAASESTGISQLIDTAQSWIADNCCDVPSTSSSAEVSPKSKKTRESRADQSQTEACSSSKAQPMKTAQDVINRLIWDTALPRDHFVVGYQDRFVGIVELPFSSFNWSVDFVDVDLESDSDFAVPQHRIQYFKYKSAKIWDKASRFDAVFQSAGCRESIDNIIRKEDAADP